MAKTGKKRKISPPLQLERDAEHEMRPVRRPTTRSTAAAASSHARWRSSPAAIAASAALWRSRSRRKAPTSAALPHLRKGSAIINTASVTAYRGSAELVDHSATKGAIAASFAPEDGKQATCHAVHRAATGGHMAVTKERFAQGMTYDEYKAQMTRNKEKFEEHERTVELPAAELEAIRKAPRTHVLVLTEDWCGDALANVPIVGRLAKETGRLDVRVFLRDQNDDLMAQYMNGEFKSIPVFAFFDDSFREIGRWIERPASVTERRKERRAKVFASDPRFGSPDRPVDQLPEAVRADLMAALQKMRDEMRPFADAEVIREIREIVTKQR